MADDADGGADGRADRGVSKAGARSFGGTRRGEQLRQPRLAELVAGALRNEILSGNLTDGDSLPRQEDLLDDFGVSPPAVREALRILETEGLIRVRRGNVGGAVVKAPSAGGVAYMVGLVLQSWQTPLADVGRALGEVEPVCAALCARSRDRYQTVVPVLRDLVEEQGRVIEDTVAFNQASRRFHEALVANCGSDTLKVVVGALEAVWSSHEHRVYELGPEPDMEVRRAALRAHEKLVDAIEAGDEAAAAARARSHLEATQSYTMARKGESGVSADLVRNPASTAGD
ncbi:MAG TPA: FCD domain-containing protein [Acidimicrobiales bacterium]|nr:FCD domain-containing protein [Acidimicrobiales bacterium]